MLKYSLLIVFLLVPFFVFSEQKNNICVWVDKNGVKHFESCNEDLKRHEENKKSFFESVPAQNFFVLPSVPSVAVPRKIVYNSSVIVKLSGCITLQDSIEKKIQGSGAGSMLIPGRGRTEKQICDSVGSGCDMCRVLLP